MRVVLSFNAILFFLLVSMPGKASSVYTNSFDGSFKSFIEKSSFLVDETIRVKPLSTLVYLMNAKSIKAFSALKINDDLTMPDFVLRKVGKYNPSDDNSNCFGAAFNFHSSVNEYVTYIPGVVLSRVLSRGFRKLSEESRLKFGDVLIIRDYSDKELLRHAAVYVGDDIFFHKPGHKASYPWVYEEFSSLILEYIDDYNLIEVYRKIDDDPLKLSIDDVFLK